jgi:integrase
VPRQRKLCTYGALTGAQRMTEVKRSTIARAVVSKDRPERPYEVRAAHPAGLLLRVQPSGARTFYVQIARSRRVRIGPAGTWTLAAAQDRAKKILLDPEAHQRSKHRGVALLNYIEDDYEEHALAKLKNGARSVARVRAVWKPLLTKAIGDIKPAEVDRIRNKRLLAGVAPATVNRDVAALSGVFAHWAEATKSPHPLAGFEPLKVADDETIRYLTPSESNRLRRALADRDALTAEARRSANAWRSERGYELLPEIVGFSDHITPMTLLTLNTGLRQGEVFSLTWEQIDMERKTLTVLASHAKGNATRTIPLNAEAATVLHAIRPEQASGLVFPSPATGGRLNNIKKAWAEVTKAAKLSDLRWHDLRHDFASQLVLRGVPLFTVQRLLGHANPKMTMRYAKLAPEALAAAVAVLGSAA